MARASCSVAVMVGVVAALSVSWGLTAMATETGDPLDRVSLTSPSWSPDGRHIAFGSDHMGGKSDIWVVHPSGTGLERSTTSPAEDSDPKWSSDASLLYFISDRTGKYRRWRKILSTGVEEEAPHSVGDDFDLSHDGLSIVISVSRDTTWGLLIASATSGAEQSWLASNASAPSWSPNDQEVAFMKDDRNIWVRGRDKTNMRQLTTYTNEERIMGTLDWGSSGFIAFSMDGNIYKVRPDGTDLTCIYSTGDAEDPDWSPDGTKLVIVRSFADGQDLYIINADGSSPTQVTQHVAAPAFSPDYDTFAGEQSVAISCATPGVTIRYTTDGTDPTESSSVYTTPIPLDRSITLKAKAWKTGWISSAVRRADYAVPSPTFSPVGGTYSTAQTVTLSCSLSGVTIRYTTDGTEPDESSTLYTGPVAVDHSLSILAKAWKTNWTASEISGDVYELKLPALTFAPDAGTYQGTQNVTIACAVSGATIRYTTDGTDPTESSTEYTGPVAVNQSCTLKARAWKTGWTPNDIKSAEYVVQ